MGRTGCTSSSSRNATPRDPGIQLRTCRLHLCAAGAALLHSAPVRMSGRRISFLCTPQSTPWPHVELRRASSAYYISCRQATRSQGSAHVRVELLCFRNVLAQASGFGRWSVTRCSTAGHLVRSGVEKLEEDGVANMELSPSRTQTSSICSHSTRTSTLRRRPILAVRHDASTRSKACHEGVRRCAPK